MSEIKYINGMKVTINRNAVKNKNDIMDGFIKRIERIKKQKERNQDVQSNDS